LRLSSRIAKYNSAIQRKNVKCQMLQNGTSRVNKRTNKNVYFGSISRIKHHANRFLRPFKLISIDLLSSTTTSKRYCNPHQDWANKTISSAYAKINTPPTLHPTLEVTTLVSRSVIYRANNHGDKPSPCRVPLPRLKN